MPENSTKPTASTPSESRSGGAGATSASNESRSGGAGATSASNQEYRQTDSTTSNRSPDAAGSFRSEDAGIAGKAQESGREIVSRSVQAVGDRTRATTNSYVQEVSSGLHTLAEGLRHTSSTVQGTTDDQPLSNAGARYLEGLADKVEDFSSYLERKDLTALYSDVRGFAREHPAVFVGGAFAIGFAVSRLLKSGGRSDEDFSTRGH